MVYACPSTQTRWCQVFDLSSSVLDDLTCYYLTSSNRLQASIGKVFPLDVLDLFQELSTNLQKSGRYLPERRFHTALNLY